MVREAVAIVAALGAAMSVGAIGFAVLWGVEVSEPVAAPPPVAKFPAPPRPAEAAPPPASKPAETTATSAGTPAAKPPSIVFAAPGRAQDAQHAPAALAHALAPAQVTPPRRPEPSGSELVLLPQISRVAPEADLAPKISAPVALPDREPVVTVLPPAEHGHASVGVPKALAIPPGGEALRPQGPVAPRPALTRVDPAPAVRPAEPAPRVRPRERVVRTEAPARTESVVVVRGPPPSAPVAGGVVHPGPLIIKLPTPVRR